MKKYQWNYQKIRENRNTLQQMYNKESNTVRKQNIKEIIEMYDNMQTLIHKSTNIFNDDDDYFFYNINDFIKNRYLSYQNNDNDIINILLQSYLPLKEVYKQENYPKDRPIIATNEELVTITKDFISKKIPTNMQQVFIDYLNEHNNIQFSKNDITNYGGVTLIDPFLKAKYIYIVRENNLMDIIKLPHELFHYVFCNYDIFTLSYYNTYYLTEIEGSFANILFGDYYYQQGTINNNFFNLSFLELYYDQISTIVTNNALLDSISKDKIRLNKLNKYLNYFDLPIFQSIDKVVDYFETPLEILIKYALGYLVAIDLYTIYQEDEELAFYLLKNLKYVKKENNIINLFRNNNITFMDDSYENLKKYVKKIERQN